MGTFFVTFLVFAIVMIAMAVGVLISNRSIKGGCGGLNDIDGLKGACDICEGRKVCRRRRSQRQALTDKGANQADN